MYHKRFPMKRIIVLIITLALTGSHLSAREQYIYTQISHDEGLTSTINSIFKKEDGHLWIGSQNGLFTFNGTTLRHYKDPVFAAKYGPSMFNFRDDQFPESFLKEYEYAYVAYLDKERDGLPVCIAFLIKDNRIGAITVYMPTAG